MKLDTDVAFYSHIIELNTPKIWIFNLGIVQIEINAVGIDSAGNSLW